MAKARKKTRKPAKRAAKKAKRKTVKRKGRKAAKRKAKRTAKPAAPLKHQSIIANAVDTVAETMQLRRKLEGPNTFED